MLSPSDTGEDTSLMRNGQRRRAMKKTKHAAWRAIDPYERRRELEERGAFACSASTACAPRDRVARATLPFVGFVNFIPARIARVN
jgi:hypothetical protein